MTSEQKNDTKTSPILDTAGGEMPNPKAPPHSPSRQELDEAFKRKQAAEMEAEENIPESQGDLADQAEREIENDIRSGIERARRDVHH
jgi:hypothetical protein